MIFQHHRWQVWNKSQHPYYHSSDDIGYTNEAFGDEVSTIGGAIDWITKVLYPRVQDSVDDVADLPAAGNTINDYRVVNNVSTDGRPSAYRWEQREGDVAAQWYKVADYDWSTDAVVAAFEDKTQDLFVYKYGKDDADETGTVLTGDSAGQHIYGGVSANTHLTLHANSGDGTGAQTGYIQFQDDVRPLTDSSATLGTATYRWLNFYTDEANVGTMTLADGSITDSSGAIDFGNETLTTSSAITGGSFVTGTLTITDGSIEDSDGAIGFGATNLTTTGVISGGQINGDNVRLDGNTISITNINGALNLVANGTGVIDLQSSVTAGDITAAGTIDVTGDIAVDNLSLNGNTITTTNTDGDLLLAANGAGVIDAQNAMTTLGITATGTVGVTGILNVDNLRLDGNTLSTTDTDGDLTLFPNGAGVVDSKDIHPIADATHDLGEAVGRWQDLYMSGSISDGSTSITSATLQSLRDINSSVLSGDSIFWNGSKWVASAPDTEIDHGSISGLADDDHTQYVLLAGRAGGQTLIGGTGAGDDLLLESTSNVTKGQILIGDDMYPDADATHDLGGSSNQWVDLYITGQLYGARIENFADSTARGAATGTEGRLGWQVDTEELYIGTGAAWKQITTDRYYEESDSTTWDTANTQHVFDVSGQCDNARTMLWQLKDNTNNYEIMAATIDHPTSTQVRVTFGYAITAGTYTLVGR